MAQNPHHRLYGSQRWRRAAKRRLAAFPSCEACLSKNLIVPAQECDHIVRHGGNLRLFWDPANHQSLCRACHEAKTADEEAQKRRTVAVLDPDGYPVE